MFWWSPSTWPPWLLMKQCGLLEQLSTGLELNLTLSAAILLIMSERPITFNVHYLSNPFTCNSDLKRYLRIKDTFTLYGNWVWVEELLRKTSAKLAQLSSEHNRLSLTHTYPDIIRDEYLLCPGTPNDTKHLCIVIYKNDNIRPMNL